MATKGAFTCSFLSAYTMRWINFHTPSRVFDSAQIDSAHSQFEPSRERVPGLLHWYSDAEIYGVF